MKLEKIRVRGIEPRAAAKLHMRGGNVSRYTIPDYSVGYKETLQSLIYRIYKPPFSDSKKKIALFLYPAILSI